MDLVRNAVAASTCKTGIMENGPLSQHVIPFSDSCNDKISNCMTPQVLLSPHAKDSCKFDNYWSQTCRKSCNLCEAPPSEMNKPIKPYACADRLPNNECQTKKANGECSNGSVMEDCLASCGLCYRGKSKNLVSLCNIISVSTM